LAICLVPAIVIQIAEMMKIGISIIASPWLLKLNSIIQLPLSIFHNTTAERYANQKVVMNHRIVLMKP